MYHNMQPSDFVSSSDFDPQKQGKLSDYASSGPYRTSTAFSAFSNNRTRQPSAPALGQHTFRDTSNYTHHYPVDVYATAQPSLQSLSPPQPSQSMGPSAFDPMLQPRSTFDFGPSPHSSSTGFVSNNKPAYANDMFTGSTGSSLLPSHKSTGHLSGPGSQQLQAQSLQTQPPQSNFHPTSQAQYMNGLHQQQLMQSQTAFGPHLPSSTSAPITTQGGTSHTNGSTQAPSQEEISTIFVVGFPEDMQVRVSTLGKSVSKRLTASCLVPLSSGARISEHVHILTRL